MRIPSQFFLRIVLCASLCLSSGCVALAIGVAGGAAAGGVESARAHQREAHSPATYVATVISNAFYLPAKVIFAGAGALTSGVAFLVTLGDREVSGEIWESSVYGDYLITPSMIEGKEPLQFVRQ